MPKPYTKIDPEEFHSLYEWEPTDAEEIELGNGETLAERLDRLRFDEWETMTTDELREELGLVTWEEHKRRRNDR